MALTKADLAENLFNEYAPCRPINQSTVAAAGALTIESGAFNNVSRQTACDAARAPKLWGITLQ